jgi:hypothetical protein
MDVIRLIGPSLANLTKAAVKAETQFLARGRSNDTLVAFFFYTNHLSSEVRSALYEDSTLNK